ncbi:wsae [Stenotrophomonas rhizophila]|uniref:wsae n=1 Tax=Stenotrophomonas rhizophila TaxID=216778 RepID=UPI0027962129|nr:wsae [Stenotrophomonas rhizophila]
MARVAGRAVIVGFPPQRPWVEQAEEEANGRWHELFGEDYVWLQEHKEFGLVETSEVVQTFEAAGMEVLRFGQGNASLWASLMGAHFIKVKFPELEPLVEAADRLYNSRVFAGDHSDEPYREYYVAVRRDADAARLRADPPFQARSDAEATALLNGLASGLRALALRAHNAECEWESTARMLDAYIADLAVAKREWGATAEYVHQLQAAKDQGDVDWQARDAASQVVLQRAQEELRELGEVVAKRESELAQADERLQREREQQAQVRRDLERKLEDDAVAYARSRRRWALLMLALTIGGLLAGYLAAQATL